MPELPAHPCLALPFTIVPAEDGVHLLAGEDWRYVLAGPDLTGWLPAWLGSLDGTRSLAELLAELTPDRQRTARAILERLLGERLVREGPITAAHQPVAGGVAVLGSGTLADELRREFGATEPASLIVLAQEALDYTVALEHNARLRAEGRRWFWVTSGPMTRGYVGPLFLPHAGPCLACLVGHFQRLSPAPHLYDLLAGRGDIVPSPLPPSATRILVTLAVAKVALTREPVPSPALYRLHVLEADTLEVTSHAVLRDPECPVCGDRA
jgi:bacteriocin biosynthesis cyclodehydratase domain-containing protein